MGGKGRQSPSTPRSGSQECNVEVTQAICGTAGGATEDYGRGALIRRRTKRVQAQRGMMA
jgi:hypothetical protein